MHESVSSDVVPLSLHEHRRFVIGAARRLGRGELDPEDLAQDVLERWLRTAPERGAVSNPRGWMLVVLRHLVIDRRRRRRLVQVEPDGGIDEVSVEVEPRPWWYGVSIDAVERELAALPAALRETFRLFAFEARSYKQIARQLGIAPGTVGARINRARSLIRHRLVSRFA